MRSGSGDWPLRSTLGLFCLAWLILSWPWLSGVVTIPWDAKAHFYPQLQFLAQSLYRGESPFWTPFVFSGHPQIADPQSLIFSPYLLLAAFDPNPSFQAADALILVMLGMGGVALIVFFRDRAWHPAGALVAALCFAFGASAAWRIQHVGQVMSLSYLPLAIWLLARVVERGSFVLAVPAGMAAGLMALGRDQVAYLGLWTLCGFALWSWLTGPGRRDAFRRSALPVALSAVVAGLVACVPVTLTMLLSEASNRAAISVAGAGQGSLHPALFLTALVPNLFGVAGPFMNYWGPPSPRWGAADLFLARNMGVIYIGALPALLIIVAALRGIFWAREIRFFTVASVAVLLYALGRYTPFFAAVFEFIPGVSLFRRPADAAFLLGVLAAILAGYAVHRWLSATLPIPSRRRRIGEWLAVLLPLGIGAALAFQKETTATALAALVEAGLWLAAGAGLFWILPGTTAPSRRFAVLAVMGFLVLDLARNNGPNESTALPPATYELLRPESESALLANLTLRLGEGASERRLDRVELTGLGFHWPNASLVHRLHNVLGYNPVRLALYSAATGAEDHVALPDQRKFSPLFPSYRSKLADLLGLRLIATGVPIDQIDPTLKPGDLNLVASSGDGFLYENPRAMPRVLLATRAEPADFDALLRSGAWPPIDYASTVLLSTPSSIRPAPPGLGTGATAAITRYANTEVVIEAEAPSSGGYVVLNDPFHPWWRATVDGEDAPILQANVLFRAVPVPAGRHMVRFTFRPFAAAWDDVLRRLWVRH